MKMNRTLLAFAVVLALPTAASAQRFSGVMDATGMVARPAASAGTVVAPGFISTLANGTVIIPPVMGAGFFTPGVVPQLVPVDTTTFVQQVYVPFAVNVPQNDVVTAAPSDAEALAIARANSRAISSELTTTQAVLRARGPAPVVQTVAELTSGNAVGRCQTAALKQIRASNVRPDDLRFEGNSTGWSRLGNAAEVRGAGTLLDRGRWHRFRYICDLSSPTAQPRAVVSLY